MPAFTSRGYPYSIPADPTDVPQAIQDLAEAIDVDVEDRANSIAPRPTFRITSTTVVTFSTTFLFPPQNRPLPFDVQNVIVGNAIAPLQGVTQRIVPLHPGFWWFRAGMSFPRAGATSMDAIGITLQTATTVLGQTSVHLPPPVSDGANTLSVVAGGFFNGTTDYVELIGMANNPAFTVGVPQLNIRNRYLFGTRMTES